MGRTGRGAWHVVKCSIPANSNDEGEGKGHGGGRGEEVGTLK